MTFVSRDEDDKVILRLKENDFKDLAYTYLAYMTPHKFRRCVSCNRWIRRDSKDRRICKECSDKGVEEKKYMKKLLIGVYNPTIWLTYIGVFCAVTGMSLLLSAPADELLQRMDTVMILLILSGVCDMFDGAVARRFKRTEKEKQFGIELDSLADTVSFVAFPAVILLSATQRHPASVVIACFYVFAGVMRLGWFNVTTEENKGFYKGLPVTFVSPIFSVCHLVLRLLNLDCHHIVFPALFACVGLLFILNFRLKKPGMKMLLVFAVCGVLTILGLLLV